MKKRTKRLVGIAALAVGSLGATGAVLMRMKNFRVRKEEKAPDVWARPGMQVTFRAEVMPGRDASERVYRVKELLPSGRVVLHEFAGEHAERAFEPIR
ncbi:MAG: hypothetical protein H7Y30_04645 [Pyrinomonadaceae bacterium]|nr:hypothetical protein [Pyrinomonadaceae bacterium]